MVERVAKALTGHFAPIEYDHLPADKQALRRLQRQPHGLGIEVSKDDMLEAARAALSALRDLTPDVVEAGADAVERVQWAMMERDRSSSPEDMPDFYSGDVANAALTAMINTIIRESARDTDRNPEGEDPEGLRAEHESGGRNGIARTSSDRNAGEI